MCVMFSHPVFVVRVTSTHFILHKNLQIPTFSARTNALHDTYDLFVARQRTLVYAHAPLNNFSSKAAFGAWRATLYMLCTKSSKERGIYNAVYKMCTISRWDKSLFNFPKNTISGYSPADFGWK